MESPIGVRVGLITIVLGGRLSGVVHGLAISEFPIPTAISEPRGIVARSDGNVWFAELNGAPIAIDSRP